MDSTAKKLVHDFFEAMKIEAENLVFKIFPERIHHLNELCEKPEFRITSNDFEYTPKISVLVKSDDNEINGEGKIPKNDSNSCDVDPKQAFMASNKKLTEFMEIVKPHIKQLLEDINALKIWISILIPKIEDGNNFGVEVQEQALGDIYNIEKSIHCHSISFVTYYEQRAKLVTKILKYPGVEDYQKSVKEHDEHHKLVVSQTMQEIRDYYVTMHDVITKNLDKIKKPRSSHTESFY